MATVTLENLSKTFGSRNRGQVQDSRLGPFRIDTLNLTLPDGLTTVLLGPSGCGKTTLLRMVAGLVTPDSGRIFFGTRDVTELPPRERGLGMVFQTFALYPHFTSRKNILAHFVFKPKTPELSAEARAKFERTSELMGVDIAHLLERKPGKLSTGEQQRVALARCITRDPALFLLDEPFSNLDQTLREKYRANLKRLLNEFRITTLYVTHDQQEALLLADQVAIMDAGAIVQHGSYRELYQNPRTLFVANFLNPEPLTPALNLVDGDLVDARFGGKRLGVRPEDVRLSTERAAYGLEVRIDERLDLPTKPVTLLSGEVGGQPFHAAIEHPDRLLPERVWFQFERFQIFSADGTKLEDFPQRH